MKRIGMIGGFGPEATLDYYKRIVEEYKSQTNGLYPDIVIYSMDISKLFKLIELKQWNELVDWLVEGLQVLKRAGSDFGFISANTPHIVFDQVKQQSPLPLVSIVEAASDYSLSLNLKKLGLLGTKFTMSNSFFKKVFQENEIGVEVPRESDQNYIQEKYVTELENGVFKEETRKELLRIVRGMKDEKGIDGVVLGCTELPLILTKDEYGLPFLNTTKIHVDKIVQYSLM